MSEKIDRHSITRKPGSFSVAPSPLNSVKLELAIILVIAVMIWVLLYGLAVSGILQIGLLGLYGIAAMSWILFRTKRILNKVSQTYKGER